LSGTGKTTTTFTQQNDSKSVQDDFLALMPNGRVYATENGCFAKTYGLNAEFEPAIYKAVNQPEAYLENVSQKEAGGPVDYFDESYTKNGRATFCMDKVEGSADARSIKKADILLILNRNENIIPAVARLNREQAAAYFMLGETQGTSAGGAAEEGKNLRVPGTNPFFPGLHARQGNRLKELLESCNLEVYLLNTGRVGGKDGTEGSKKVKIPHSSAIVKGIAEGTIEFTKDEDFGYEVAAKVPGIGAEDTDLLQPKKLYEATGRSEEYQKIVDRLKGERREYFQRWPGLDPAIVAAAE
ncbi:MAG: phosphoenolpyruvate carboxykinase (ATP), partial [Planctomycetes bacterium]|nr:phosphoenolpyruvate carboxykinase (ATP) [Planctomycetota bacterium]